MKNLIKTAAIALATGIMCLNAGGAEPGKELLGRIKANQQIVTQEVDSVFTEWKAGQQISFPNAGTNTFWIGDKTLGQWLAENKEASQPGISQETDPTFQDWLQLHPNLLELEADPIFSDWLGTNEYVKVESDPTVPEWAKVENPPYLTNAIVRITTNGVPVEADEDTVNIQIPEQTPPLYVDSTLTTNGAAADAKKVGNELALKANVSRTTVTYSGEDGAGNARSFTARAGSLVMYDSTRTYLLRENYTEDGPGTITLCRFGGVIKEIATAQGSFEDYTLEFDIPDREDGGFPAGTFTLTRSSKLETAAYSSNGNIPAKTSDLANDGANGVPFATVDDVAGKVDSATNTLYETMTNEFVRLADIQDGITFDTMNVTNLTINGSAVSTEGHKHDASDITNLVPVTISSISTNGVAITPDGNRNIDIAVPSPVAVVAPSANAAPGTAADAKSVGDALQSGYTEWTFNQDGDYSVSESYVEEPSPHYEYILYRNETAIGGSDDEAKLVEINWSDYVAGLVSSRHLITPTKTSQLTNDSGFITLAQVPTPSYIEDANGNKIEADGGITYLDDTKWSVKIGRYDYVLSPSATDEWTFAEPEGTEGNKKVFLKWIDYVPGWGLRYYQWSDATSDWSLLADGVAYDSYQATSLEIEITGDVTYTAECEKGAPSTDKLALKSDLPTKTSDLTNDGTNGTPFALQEDVHDASNNLVRATYTSLLGKIDAENGTAFGSLTVREVQTGASLLENPITTIKYEGLDIQQENFPGVTSYKRTEIIFNNKTYGFDTTTNGIARLKDVDSATNSLYQTMTNEFVKLSDLEEGITFDTISVTNITINGKAVSAEGHKHDVSDITNLVPVTISTITTNGVAITPDGSRNVEITIPSAGEGNLIESITTNGIPLTINNKVVEIPLQDYVKISDLEGGITFDTISVTNLTINGKAVSTVDHVHSTNDITDLMFPAETDPLFMAVFGNQILNLIPYDEINLAGTNRVTITTPQLKVSDSIVVGPENTTVVSNASIIGNGNRVGIKGWYYSGIQFTTNAAGVAQKNQPATFYLTDNIELRNTGVFATNPSFESGFNVGETVSIVNNSKYDMECKITAINGNAITIDKIPFTEIVEPPNGRDFDDFTIISFGSGTSGCVELSDSSFVAGLNNTVYRKAAASFGRNNTVFGDYGFAAGRDGQVAYAASAFGASNKALAWYSFAEGFRNEATQWYSHAGGDDSKASGYSSFAHGHQAVASGAGAVAFGGVYQYGQAGFVGGLASGNGSVAGGIGAKAQGGTSVSIGSNTIANASYSVAFGNSTTASGEGSFAMGTSSDSGVKTQATKKGASAFGTGTSATGPGSFAAGALSTSSGEYSSSFGYNCKASGRNSIAGGSGTQATNECSVAFGLATKAYGGKSMAIGNGTWATGACSFAGGVTCTNNGTASFVFGSNCSVEKNYSAGIGGRLIVSNDFETVVGQWNKPVVGNRFSVGIGSNNARKNAFEVRSNGNIYMSANPNGIYISGTNLTQTLKNVILDAARNDATFRQELKSALGL